MKRALVLGGGGLAGIAWEIGLLAGPDEAGLRLRDADLLVGTSAGSAVATQLASGLPLAELLARQVDPAIRRPTAEAGRRQGAALAAEVAAFWG